MNNAKIWLVVPPAVGVPVFLGAVAVGSFAVHVAVLTNTSWVGDFLKGVPMGTGDMESAALQEMEPNAANAAYVVPGSDGAQKVIVIMPDGTTKTAVLQDSEFIAASAAPPPLIDTH